MNETINRIGRKLMSGDVLELPHIADDTGLDNSKGPIPKFYVVEDVSRGAEGFDPMWWPHITRVNAKALQDTVEFVETDLAFITPTYPEILIDRRDELAKYLHERKIGCRAVYNSLSSQPFHGLWATPTPVTDSIGARGLQLPGQANLTDLDIKWFRT